ncbi:MAG: ECF transporter S component [Clostridiales bacterium]|jgi:ECF transporter S component (folate family)|nr:ECF transporter S component [Clostridiales bacterium]
MDTKMSNFVRPAVCVLSVLAAAAFFVPWISVFNEETLYTAAYSPLEIALGAGFPYGRAYPAAFAQLAIPLVIAISALTKQSFRKIMLAAAAGMLTVTAFNLHFAFALDYRPYAAATALFWLVVIIHAAILGLAFFGIKATKEASAIENIDPPYSSTQKLTVAGLLLAMAVIIALLRIPIYVGGVQALRISFAGIFTNTTAILFGPFFGGVVRALEDLISHFMRPGGAFLWPITVVAFLRGAATGWMWLKVRGVRPKVYSVAYTVVFAAILAFGLFNLSMQLFLPDSAYVIAMQPREGQGLFFATAYYISSWGLIAAGIIGLAPQLIVYRITRKADNTPFYDRFIKFLVAVMVPGLIFNSINSVIIFLAAVSPAAFQRGFVYFWAPRFFEELVTSTIIVYIMVILMEVYEKAMKRKIIQGAR